MSVLWIFCLSFSNQPQPTHLSMPAQEMVQLKHQIQDQIANLQSLQNQSWHRLDKRVLVLEEMQRWTAVLRNFTIGGSLLALVAAIFAVWQYVRSQLQLVIQRSKTQIDHITGKALQDFTSNGGAVERIIWQSHIAEKIRRQYRILIFAGQTQSKAERVLHQLQFRNVTCQQPRNDQPEIPFLKEVSEPDFDLIIFESLPVAWINQYISLSQHRYFVVYAEEHLNGLQHRGRINLANSTITLVPRIMEVGQVLQMAQPLTP